MFIVKAWLKNSRELDVMERHLRQRCHASRWTCSQLHFGLAPQTQDGKRKMKDYSCFAFKGIGLLPPALFFLPWTRVYSFSWLLNRWRRWKVQKLMVGLPDSTIQPSGYLPNPTLTGSTFMFLENMFLRKKNKNCQTTTKKKRKKKKRKRATSEHFPHPLTQ